ncbi:serine/threonine protein phosphatase [Thioclava sp. SK-1]|uniref:metallophosphoesterase n=1 Tax=Thioclava sp. SK-1 TaxID=1889770 RepID=UPI000825BBF9|nr:metallophosphoesterase [Thioclava sp. SK-1]OCX65817.1 serine/threonine protein phosphatase [Thioclava sp. SK-1]
MRAYAIGDIHGHTDKLKQAHALIAADQAAYDGANVPVVHVGDMVDRGPDSSGTIEYLMQGMASGKNWIVLKGNHDRMFSMFMDDPYDHDMRLRTDLNWIHPRLGGNTTLASYGVENAEEREHGEVHVEAMQKIPASHRAWLAARPSYFLHGDLLFVHAGIKPGVKLGEQIEDDLLWIRKGWLEHPGPHQWLIVHGHTALDDVTHYGHRLNLDSSAGYGGPVSAVVIEGRDVFLLTAQGRVPLQPTEET